MNRHKMSKASKVTAYGASLVLVVGSVFVAGAPAAAAQRPAVTTPTGFQAEVGASSVTVTWEPSRSRAAEITSYTLQAAGRWFTVGEPSLTMFLERDTTYRVVAQAKDAEHNRSEWSEEFFFTTPDQAPVTTPGNVRVTTAPGTATVDWDASSSDAGVLDYLVFVTGGSDGTAAKRSSGTSVTFDLPAGGDDLAATVETRDRAYRDSDRSDPVGFAVQPTPGFSPPGAPENLEMQFDSRGRSFLATWDASPGTGPVTYQFQISGQEVDSTRDLELAVFDFVRCDENSGPFFDEVTVIATANGFESPPSNPVKVCFG